MTDREVTAQRRMHDAAQKIAELLDEGERGLRLDDACVDWRAASVEYTRACKLQAMLDACEAAHNDEAEGGGCNDCGALAAWLECSGDGCDSAAWVINCGHYAQPRALAAGRADGSDATSIFCDSCAERDADAGSASEVKS